MNSATGRSPGVMIIAVVNLVAAALTLAFWILVYVKLFSGAKADASIAPAALSATFGFLVGDLVWAVPLLIISAAGLLKRKAWGLLTAQMVNILWLYSMTAIWVRDLHAGMVSPGAVLFTPFALFAVWAIGFLWKRRGLFSGV